ncbi:nuclear transport factor 2 family protein [Flavobacteriaceae bacterium]|nr:nuclear transport factor 2 family protein [Flavobacteriaceae bacterium]
MKKLLLITLLFSASLTFAQKTVATVKDSDELTLNVRKLNQTYVENDFSLWNELFADDAVVYVNNSKMDKQTVIAGFKGHHSIFNNIQIPNITAQTKYGKDVWTNEWFTWMGTGNKTGIRYSNAGNFNYKWENGKIVMMLCYFDTAGLNMEIAAQ